MLRLVQDPGVGIVKSRRDGGVEMACAECLKSPLLLLPVLEGGTS